MRINMDINSKLNHNIKNKVFFINIHAYGNMRKTRTHETEIINHEEVIPQARMRMEGIKS